MKVDCVKSVMYKAAAFVTTMPCLGALISSGNAILALLALILSMIGTFVLNKNREKFAKPLAAVMEQSDKVEKVTIKDDYTL